MKQILYPYRNGMFTVVQVSFHYSGASLQSIYIVYASTGCQHDNHRWGDQTMHTLNCSVSHTEQTEKHKQSIQYVEPRVPFKTITVIIQVPHIRLGDSLWGPTANWPICSHSNTTITYRTNCHIGCSSRLKSYVDVCK